MTKQATDDAITLFGNKEAGGIVPLKTYSGYQNGEHSCLYVVIALSQMGEREIQL